MSIQIKMSRISRGKRFPGARSRLKHLAIAAVLLGALTSMVHAEGKVLILEPQTGFDGDGIKTQLQNILQGAGIADANVAVIRPAVSANDSLAGWFHRPYGSTTDTPPIWSNLRGEDGTAWDYVVILENPEAIETLPGWYAQGVHDVAQEVEKGSGQAVLLMQWNGTNATTQEYYREVTYRVGRGRGVPVVPAGLARQARLAAGTSVSEQDAAYIAAASIYSRLWNKSAAESSYSYNDAMAQTAFDTVNANRGVEQYSGPFTKAPSGVQTIKDNRKRELLAKQLIQFHWGYNPAEGEAGSLNHRIKREGLIIRETNLGHYDLNFYYGRPRTDIVADKDSELMLPNSFDRHNDVSFNSLSSFQRGVTYEYYDGKELAEYWLDGDEWYRHHPLDLLFAQTAHYPLDAQAEFRKSGTPFHSLSAAYMFTIMTGRCPVPLHDDGTVEYIGDRIGYETAWRLSTLHGRAPGFKTWPTQRLRKTAGHEDPATLQVAFALQPEQNVTVSVSCSETFASVSPQTLTFTPSNYNVPQSVAVTTAPGAPPSAAFDVIFTTESDDLVCHQLNQSWTYRVNQLPVANDMTVSAYADETNEIKLDGTDADGETLEYIITRPPSHGIVVIEDMHAMYTPTPGYVGPDSFAFQAKNFATLSREATVTINVEGTPGYGRNLLKNGNAEAGSGPGLHWVAGSGTWTYPKQSYNPVKNQFSNTPFEGLQIFSPHTGAGPTIAELYQDVDVSRYRAAIDRGAQTFQLSAYHTDSGTIDKTSFLASYWDDTGTMLGQYDSLPIEAGFNWLFFSQELTPPAGTTRIRVQLRSHDEHTKSPHDGRFDQVSLLALQPTSLSQPSAYAGADQLIYDADGSGSEIIYLNGGSSYDNGTIDSYIWKENGSQIATGASAEVDLSLGVHTLTLTVTDNDGNTASDSLVVTITGPKIIYAGPDQLNVALATEPVEIAPISDGLYNEWDAAKDSDGNNSWTAYGSSPKNWTFLNGAQTQEIVDDPRFNALSRTYAFPAAAATGSHYRDREGSSSATFEYVINIDGPDGMICSLANGHELRVIGGTLRYEQQGATFLLPLPHDLGGWIHLVVVLDGTNRLLQLYVDGELADTRSVGSGGWGSRGSSVLGTDFVGRIALMRIYDKVFSAEDVRANFHALSIVPRNTVDLTGSASDPQNPALMTKWTVASTQPAGLTVDFADRSALATTATFTAPGTYTLRLTAGSGADAFHDEMVVKITDTPSNGFSDWASNYNLGGLDGYYDNPDGDAHNNMMEFAFGTDPTQMDMGPLAVDGSRHGQPLAMQDTVDDRFWIYFIRRTDGSLNYTACFSNDLTNFEERMDGLQQLDSPGLNPGYQLVRVPFPANLGSGGPAKFGYIRVGPIEP